MTVSRFSINPLAHVLIYAGSIPFIAGAILSIMHISEVPFLGKVSEIIAIYGLIISVFLCGIHWGQELLLGHSRQKLLITSNIITVIVWLIWLLVSPKVFMAMLTLPYLALIYIDFLLFRKSIITCDYYQSRVIITSVVVISLLISSVLS
jgi:hypothetical protein